MVQPRVRGAWRGGPLSLLLTALTSALLLVGLLPSIATATSFAARASVSGGPQYVNDSVGTTFTFTVKNTGYPTKIGAVKISRPFSAWTVTACAGAPAGWTASPSAGNCIFSSPAGPTDDISPGASATFMLTATTVPEAADINGTWQVIASKTSTFSSPSNLIQAGAMGAGLKTRAYSFQVLSAVVSATPATPGAACPTGSMSAPAASTGNFIVICGRNRSTGTRTPNAAHSSLSGTFIASHGAFSSGPVAPSTTSRVLGNWSNVTITSVSGSGQTIIASIGRLSQQSPKTTLNGFTALNSPPTVTTSAGATAYTENDPPTAIDPSLTVTDPDDATLVAAKVRISAGFVSATDTLGFTNQNGIAGSYNSATGVLDLTGSASVANYQAALRSVTYYNSSDTPTTNRTIAFSASDIHAFGAEATKGIAITPVNDAPQATNLNAAETYTEDTPLNLIDIVVSDVDNSTTTATLTLSDPSAGSLNTATSGAVTSTYNAGTGVWSASGAISDVNSLLAGLTFTPASNYNSNFSIATSVSDGIAPALTGSKAMTGIAVNDAPQATNLKAAETYTEDTPLNLIDIVVSDVDNSTTTATLTLSDPSAGSLNTATSGAVTSTYNAGTGVWSASGAISDVNSLLAGLTFTPASNYNSNFSIATSVSDGIAPALTGSKAMTGIAVNDAPTVTTTGGSASFRASGPAVIVDPGVAVSDIDSPNLAGATISIAANFSHAAGDALNFVNQNGITGSYDATTGVLTLTGSASLTDYQAALRSITFSNTDSAGTDLSTRTVTFQVDDGSAANNLSNSATRDVAVTPPNSPPVAADQIGGNTVTTNEDAPVTVILSATDADNDLLTFSIVGSPTNGVLGTIGTPNCSAPPTCTANVQYTPAANYNGPDSFTFKANDGIAGDSNTATVDISITPVNDAPVLDAGKSPTLGSENEDPGAPGVGSGTLVSDLVDFAGGGGLDNVTDVDSGAQLGIAITSVDGFDESVRGSISSSYYSLDGGATWTPMSSLADNSALLLAADSDNRIYFKPGADLNGTFIAALTFRAWDRTSGSDGTTVDASSNGGSTAFSTASDTADLIVNPVNDPPDIGHLPALTTNEDTPFIFGNANKPSVSDVDAGSGQIQMSVSVSHGTLSLSGTSGLSFSFNDANGIGAGDGTADAAMTFRGTLTDINAALSGLVYTPGVDYNGPDTLSYVVNDLGNTGSGGPLTVSVSTAITVTPVNDAPTLHNIESTALGYTENDPATAITSTTTVADVDSTDFNTGTLTVNYTAGGAAEDRLEIANQGTGAGQIGVSGSNVTFGGTTFGTFTGGSGATALVVTFNSAAATPTAVQALVRDVTYRNVSDNPSTATRAVRFVLTDGDGGTSLPATRDITVTAVNDAPVLADSGSGLSYTENDPATAINTAITISDVDSTNMIGATVQLTTGYNSAQDVLSYATALGITGSFNSGTGTLTLSGTTTLANYQTALRNVKYANSSDDPTTTARTAVFQVNDGGALNNLSNTISSTVSVTAVNDPPTANAFSNLPAQAAIPINYPVGKLGGTDVEAGTTITIDTTPINVTNGTASLSADGSFTFTPLPNATTGSFQYRVSDNGNPAPGLNSAYVTVSFTVASPAIYFVKSSAVGSANCTLGNECTLGTALTNIGVSTNAKIFLEDANNHAGSATLNSGGWLIGQGVTGTAFDALFNIVAPAQGTLAARPSLGLSRPTVQSTVTLNTNSSVRGLNIASTTSTAMADPAAAVTGVTVSEVGVTTTTGTGVNLSDVAGTFTFDSLTTAGGTGASLTDGAGAGNNASATFNFSGVTISSAANAGFVATGGGIVNVTGSGNTLATTTATALNVANTTIGASGLTFRSISAGTGASGPASGIILNNTGASGGLTVAGTGSAGTGGTIQKTTAASASLTSTKNVSLSFMIIQNSAAEGILGTSVDGFTLISSSVTGNGAPAGTNKDGIKLTDTVNAVTFTSDTVTGNFNSNVQLTTGGSSTAAMTTFDGDQRYV